MRCPFELPVEVELITQHGGINLYRIKGLIWPYTKDEADYIVQAINCHKKLIELLKYPYELPMNEAGDYDENVEWQKKVEQVLKEAEK